METKETQVIVIGAGYAGLLATMRLAGKLRKNPVKVTLVNASDMFVERLRLHQLAANRRLKERPIAKVLAGTKVDFVHGHVTALDTASHTVAVQTGAGTTQLQYDRLVYALGSLTDLDRVPGVRENAYTLSMEGELSVPKLKEQLQALNASGGTLVVCGAGPTGIESAAEFAGTYSIIHVQLVTQGPFGRLWGNNGEKRPTGAAIAEYMRKSLTNLGVTILDNTAVTELRPSELQTDKGTIAFDLCLWTGGFVAPPVARQAGLSVNEHGQILVDPFMRSISHPDITAIGDAAYPVEDPGVKVRMSAVTATILGAHGADCLIAELQGRTPRPLSFGYLGQAIALGPLKAIGFNNYPDDLPRQPLFKGRLGYEGREIFVRLLATLPLIERRLPGSFFWLGKGLYAASLRKKQRGEQVQAKVRNQEGRSA